jgi:hypothetical protein
VAFCSCNGTRKPALHLFGLTLMNCESDIYKHSLKKDVKSMSVIFGSLSEACRSAILDFADDPKETAVLAVTHGKVLECAAIFYSYKFDDYDMLVFDCSDDKLLSSWKTVEQEYHDLCKSIFQDKGMQFSVKLHPSPDNIRYLHIAVFKDHVMFIYYTAKSLERSQNLHIVIKKFRRSGSGLRKFMEHVGDIAFKGFDTENLKDPIERIDFMLSKSEEKNLEWKFESTEAAVAAENRAVAFASGHHKELGKYSKLFDLPEDLLQKIYLKSEESISTFQLFTILKDWLISKHHQHASSSSEAEFCCALCNKIIPKTTCLYSGVDPRFVYQ